MTNDEARALEQHIAAMIHALWADVPLTPVCLVRQDCPITEAADGVLILWPPLCRN